MLGTYPFALAAAYAVGCLSAPGYKALIKVLCSPVIRITSQCIDGPEHIRDTDLHGTAVGAVLTGRTSYLGYPQEFFRNFVDHGHLIICKRLKIRKGLQVVLHLLFG